MAGASVEQLVPAAVEGVDTSFACESSSLHTPAPNIDDTDYVEAQRRRYSKPGGSCPVAQEMLTGRTNLEGVVLNCPAIVERMHQEGYPREVKCAAALVLLSKRERAGTRLVEGALS